MNFEILSPTSKQDGRSRARRVARAALPAASDRVIRLAVASALMGLSADTIRARAKSFGDLPAWFKHGAGKNSPILFRLSDVDRWVASR